MEVVHGDRVGVARPRRPDLALEALSAASARDAGAQHLDRDGLPRGVVEGLEDHPGAACAQNPPEQEPAADGLPGLGDAVPERLGVKAVDVAVPGLGSVRIVHCAEDALSGLLSVLIILQ